ncbi:GAF domain-containing protein [Salicibibacter halophilus]|uniref:GAF domain-containing protein n=1 Tax=Salicibibacter halophilus TaxID=2502791 RepID=A0A514LFL9_9BACI|nr:GAF domain-containing protein [Salicibibacter halophilus]QDI90667.1 GAF domain-containing protein [Salicibibacter halophilus]
MLKTVEAFLNHQPDWVYFLTGIIIVFGLITTFILIGRAAMKYTEKIDKELGFQKIQQELHDTKYQAAIHKDIALQTIHALRNAERFLEQLQQARRFTVQAEENLQTYENLIIRIVHALSSDIKFQPGEQHRSAVWIEESGQLVYFTGSNAFDDRDGNQILPMNETIAGRSFRKKEIQLVPDVSADVDGMPKSHNGYGAILCIPLSEWGVLTVDAHRAFQNEVMYICRIYARVIDLAFFEYSQMIDDGYITQQFNENE